MLKVKTVIVGAYSVNCYIAYCTETMDGILIDPGDEAGRIKYFVDDIGVSIKEIVLTHAHSDHIGAVNALKAHFGVKTALYVDENDIYSNSTMNLTNIMAEYPIRENGDILLNDGDYVTIGNEKLKVLHTPGHTKGSICLYGGGVLFSGDTLFAGTYGRIDFPTGDEKRLAESLSKIMQLPENTLIYPGHYESTTLKTEKQYNRMALRLIEEYYDKA